MSRLLYTYISILILGSLCAQSNLKEQAFVMNADSISIDSVSFAPHTVFLFDEFGTLIPDSLYRLEAGSASIIAPRLKGTSIKAKYRTLPYTLNEPYFHKDHKRFVFDTMLNRSTLSLNKYDELYPAKDESQVQTNGSIARGISVGNNQDLIMNSSMNLQVEGYVTNNVQIRASISDQNVPIQPDGNSQQISEFDQIYIQLYTEDHSATFGDFETEHYNGEFLKYQKKGLGVKGESKLYFEKERDLQVDASFAVSKGKFCSQNINGIEGNQGPYRLLGCNNELYIIILSGSERVYINGKQMKRGEDNDYVIDYNAGEITFTAHRHITKDSRIVVEFEYSEQNYARFFLSENLTFKTKKTETWVNIFSEQDNKNQPFQQDSLESVDDALAQAGDGLAYVYNVREDTTWNPNKIYYELHDTTLLDGRTFDSVYTQSFDQEKGKYILGFTYVGPNKGDYSRVQSIANGKVYAWQAPSQNGTPMGEYLPVRILTAPEKRQIIASGTKIQLGDNTELFIEGSVSHYDRNTASPIDSDDDNGMASNAKLTHRFRLDSIRSLTVFGSGQVVSKQYAPMHRIRSVEFERDWVTESDTREDEYLTGIGCSFHTPNIKSSYNFKSFLQGEVYTGQRQTVDLQLTPKAFVADLSASTVQAESKSYSSVFHRTKADVSQKIAFMRIGVTGQYEHNNKQDSLGVLRADAERFYEYGAYTQLADSGDASWKLSYLERWDEAPDSSLSHLKEITHSTDYKLDLALLSNPNHTFSTGGTYRILDILDTVWGAQHNLEPEKNLSAYMEHSVSVWKNSVKNRVFIETGSGLELKRDYSYVEVTPGQGSYEWIDYNGNEIPELNEFEIARYQQLANYMRVSIPSNEYVRIYSNKFNHSLRIDPYRIWRKKNGLRKIASRLALNSNYSFFRKVDRSHFWLNLLPYQIDGDTEVHSLQSSYRGGVHINKPNEKVSGMYYYSTSTNQLLSSNGSETRSQIQNSYTVRWNTTDYLTTFGEGVTGVQKSEMEALFLSNREYHIEYYTIKPQIDIQPGPYFIISTSYNYTEKSNALGDNEYTEQNTLSVESRFSKPKIGRLTLKLSGVSIIYTGHDNTSLAYTMLEGLAPGLNYLWEMHFSKNLSQYLNLSVSYNGQQSEDEKPLHMGSIQLKAFF